MFSSVNKYLLLPFLSHIQEILIKVVQLKLFTQSASCPLQGRNRAFGTKTNNCHHKCNANLIALPSGGMGWAGPSGGVSATMVLASAAEMWWGLPVKVVLVLNMSVQGEGEWIVKTVTISTTKDTHQEIPLWFESLCTKAFH